MTEPTPPEYDEGAMTTSVCKLIVRNGPSSPAEIANAIQAMTKIGMSTGVGFSGSTGNVLFAFCGAPGYAGLLVEAIRIAIENSDDFREGVRYLVGKNGHPVTGDLATFEQLTVQ